MKRYQWGMAAALAVAVGAAACSGASGAPDKANEAAAPTVVLGPRDVATVVRADLVAGVPVSGTLVPAVNVRISSPIPEVLDAVLVKEGQRVTRGQVLARFRTNVVEPEALSAEARRRLAEADYDRMQNLYREGAVPQRDVDNALVVLRAAQAAEAAARQRLAESEVRAPISGVITTRHVQAGDRVKDGDPLFQLVNVVELEFEATVPSEHAVQVRRGAPVSLAVTGLDAGVAGTVSRINATADPATRQLAVYVAVPNRDGRLVGGLFASGRIAIHESRGVLAVPQAALRSDDSTAAYVLVVERGTLTRRTVTAGITDERAGLVGIAAGLEAGELVVVGPAEGLQPGQHVNVAGREG